jgi:hypothetical protein
MELVPVTSVNDTGLANVIIGVLEQAGIEAVVSGSGREDALPTPSVSPFHVLVREADADRARDVLAQYETMPDEEDEDV